MSAVLNEMSGLDIMRLFKDKRIPAPPIAEIIPMDLVHCEDGFVRFTAIADERHTNPMGLVAGGFICTVLDSTTGCAVHTKLKSFSTYATMKLETNMVKVVPVNVILTAEATVQSITNNVCVVKGTLFDVTGTEYATAIATCKIIG